MVSAEVLSAIAGFAGSLVAIGTPAAKVALDTRRDARKAVRLLTGHEETTGDGVIPRLRAVEEAIEREDIEIPDPSRSER